MRIWSFFFAIGLALSSLVSAHAGAAEAMLEEASAALGQGRYEEAVALAGTGLAEPGTTSLTRARLMVAHGLARQAEGANDDALVDFTAALSVSTLPIQEQARALFARGVSLDSLGRLDDALGDYDGVLKLVPEAPYALNNRANIYRRRLRLVEARRDYLASLAGSNSNPQYPYYGLGQIAEAEGDIAAARDFYTKALVADPGFQLVLERLLALGLPPEGMVADRAGATGSIVLRPPPPHPVESSEGAHPAVPTMASGASHKPPMHQSPDGSSGGETALRPAIVGRVPEGALVQLGAWRSREEAQAGWIVARGQAGGLLDGLNPLILQAEIPGRGLFYRLRVRVPGPAAQFCGVLARQGMACLPAG